MINSLSYKLIKQPNTISEEVFSPNETLINYIKENASRILVIQASNSSGKSFLLNIIAYAFYALDLNKDELPDSLRRSINYLIDEEHQTIDYNISISDPDGFYIESSKNPVTNKPTIIRTKNNIQQAIDKTEFIKEYKLLYDIPEKPLDRIYQLLKSIKDFNSNLLNQLNPLDLKIDKILRLINEERDEEIINTITERVKVKKYDLASNIEKKSITEDNLQNLLNQKNLVDLKKLLNDFDNTSKSFETVSNDLKNLTPPSKENIVLQNNSKIIELKNKIKELNIVSAINSFKVAAENNAYSNKIKEDLDQSEIDILELVYKSNQTILDLIIDNDLEGISKISANLKAIKEYSFSNFFNNLKKDLKEDHYKLVKNLTSDFKKYEADIQNDSLIKVIFKKSITEILNELKQHQNRFEEISKINDLQTSINYSIDSIVAKLNHGKSYGKELSQEHKKQKKAPLEHKKYNDILNKRNDLFNKKNKQSNEIQSIRLKLEKNKISLLTLESMNDISTLIESLNIKNNSFKGKEEFQIDLFKKEIKQFENLILQLQSDLLEDKIKLKIESNKISSNYSEHKNTIQIFSNKLSYFIKWLNQNNSLIKENGELDTTDFDKNTSYMKLIGEFVASLMGNKILYQNRIEDITFIDYSSVTPCFITNENKRIAFSDFSGGQGSSNYLKAKLNTNENRKHIVLIDEIANMDNKSLNEVINRLKDLEKNNKLLVAILVEPQKEENVFNIQAY
jgi:hypothetical protein